MFRRLSPVLGAVAAGLLLVLACGDDKSPNEPPPPPPPPPPAQMPDFTLVDVNPNTATSGQAVSPRQYQQKISAWYFGHAT